MRKKSVRLSVQSRRHALLERAVHDSESRQNEAERVVTGFRNEYETSLVRVRLCDDVQTALVSLRQSSRVCTRSSSTLVGRYEKYEAQREGRTTTKFGQITGMTPSKLCIRDAERSTNPTTQNWRRFETATKFCLRRSRFLQWV